MPQHNPPDSRRCHCPAARPTRPAEGSAGDRRDRGLGPSGVRRSGRGPGLRLRRDRARGRRDAPCRRRTSRRHSAALGRSDRRRRAGFRSAKSRVRRRSRSSSATTTTMSPFSARWLERTAACSASITNTPFEELMFPALKERQSSKDVNFDDDDRGTRRYRDGGAWRLHRRDQRATGGWPWCRDSTYNRRITALTPNEARRPGCGRRAAQDQGRSGRREAHRHDQQLRRRHDAVGHVSDGRGEFQQLLSGRSCPSGQGPRRRSGRELQALRRSGRCGRPGASFTTASISAKEPNEPNRFGWIVEIDPLDRAAAPGEAHGARPVQA